MQARPKHNFGRSTLGRLLYQQVPNADDRRSVLIMFMQLLFGGRPAFGTGSPEEKSLAELFVQALGLEAAQTDRVGGAAPWLPKDITPYLEEIAGRKLLSMKRLARGLFSGTPQDLDHMRHDPHAFTV